jgi:glycerate dehydrogenase
MQIVFADALTTDFGDIDFSRIEALGTYKAFDYTSIDQTEEHLKEAEVLITNKFIVNEEVISLMPNLKYVCVAATGFNNINIEALKNNGIIASNVRGYSTSGVAQHVFAMLTNHFNKIQHYIHETKKGRWQQTRDFCFMDHSIEELSEKTIGIIGFGNIGKAVAKIAHAYGMKTMIHSAYPLKSDYAYVHAVSLEELYRQCDIISLHAPLNDKTLHLVNEYSLGLMKSDVILVNTGRGPLIHDQALISFLKNNPSAHALLDVLSVEPPKEMSELFTLNNCSITPHIAWASKSSRQKLVDSIAENIAAYISGTPINRIA